MEQLERIITTINKNKPFARFDKASLYRSISDEQIARTTAKYLIGLYDQKRTIQQFAASLGKGILCPYDKENELEQDVKKNEMLCGLTIVRGLLNDNILQKRFEKVCIGQDEEGNPIYEEIIIGGFKMFKKVWNVYVLDNEYINSLFWAMPVEMNYKNAPSLYKPKTRSSFFCREGGHLVTKLNRKYIRLFNRKAIPTVYKHINHLQSIEWRVNQKVYNAILSLKDKYSFQDVGQERDFNMAMSYAQNVFNKHFYFYWFLDRRGRYYCGSSYLTPQGNKLSKSLLLLNNKKALGLEGMYWLKVHTANALGYDKLPIDDRADLIDNHLELIRAIGENPVDSYDYWKGASEPEVFLAACIEIAEAYKLDNPEEYETGLLVGQDATCSGVQIMSYITRDEVTGQHVNITDNDKIGDLYQFVADFIDWDQDWFWNDYKDIVRWLCKRPTMTRYYSAGVDKIAEALMADCKQKLIFPSEKDCGDLATAIVKVCNENLKGPAQVMKLLQKMGTKLADDNKLLYVRGLHNNFPFIQSYTYADTDRVSFKNGKERLTLTYVSKESGRLNMRAIASGSSPNFIHHLDSQLVSAMIDKASDYEMIPTHDCFYTLPCDAGKMFEDSRNAMFELFGTKDYLQEVCDSLKVKNTANYGNLDPKWILDNQYCFS